MKSLLWLIKFQVIYFPPDHFFSETSLICSSVLSCLCLRELHSGIPKNKKPLYANELAAVQLGERRGRTRESSGGGLYLAGYRTEL